MPPPFVWHDPERNNDSLISLTLIRRGESSLRSDFRDQDTLRFLSCQGQRPPGSGSFCQRSFTSFRMTSLASVILEPFGPARASRAGSAKGKNLNSCRALARKSQADPLPNTGRSSYYELRTMNYRPPRLQTG